ncbi:MAG: glycoside hydrolase family 20 zincin-like fold domain-containing protein [Planctomycetota bacterium]
MQRRFMSVLRASVVTFCGLALPVCMATQGIAATAEVSKAEEVQWLRWVIPLPKEIQIARKVEVPASQVKVTLRPGAGEVEKQAAEELSALLAKHGGSDGGEKTFEILVGVCDGDGKFMGHAIPDAGELSKLPNRDQAYVIRPLGDGRLALAALNERGVYYASQTLQQLIESRFADETVTIPLAVVTDWPDIEERGLWNNDAAMIPWMATLKINFFPFGAPGLVHPQRGEPIRMGDAPPMDAVKAGRRRGFTLVHRLPHYDFVMSRYGVGEAYPELLGKGARAKRAVGRETYYCPCASNPLLARITTEMMTDLAARGAKEIAVWQSESPALQCECDECLKSTQSVLEAKAGVAAWREVKKEYPDLKLRIFFCFRDANFDFLPTGVKAEKVYNLTAPFLDYAANGGWLASYNGPYSPRVEGAGLLCYATQMKDFCARMQEQKIRGAYCLNRFRGPGAYQQAVFAFPISAFAEWSWNVNGRTLDEFAVAWATRQGYEDPERVAEWVELMEPVEAPLVEIAIRSLDFSGLGAQLSQCVREKKDFSQAQPAFYGFAFGGFPTEERYDEALAACEKALGIADGLKKRDLALETKYAAAFITMLKTLNQILVEAPKADLSQAEDRRRLNVLRDEYAAAINEMIEAFDQKTDLLQAEPKTFADSMKTAHREMWETARQGMVSAVSSLPE